MADYETDSYDSEASYDEPNRSAAGQHHMKIKYGMKGLSDADQVSRLRSQITGMTGKAAFTAPNPTPNPSLADATEIADDADAAIEAYDAAVALVALRRTEKETAMVAVRQTAKAFAGYVTSVAKEDPAIAQLANMEVIPQPAPLGELDAPSKLVAKTNGLEGVIKLNWPTVRGAKSWVVERTTNPNAPESWEQVGLPPRASFVDEGLASGTKYWYRVAAVGTAGLGPWTNPTCKMAA